MFKVNSVSIVKFEQVNAGWVTSHFLRGISISLHNQSFFISSIKVSSEPQLFQKKHLKQRKYLSPPLKIMNFDWVNFLVVGSSY